MANDHVNVGSKSAFFSLKLTIVIVVQLDPIHSSCVHSHIHVAGTTVHIPSITVAVHIVAHPLNANVISDHPLDHVPLIRGYCVLNVLHEIGIVILADHVLLVIKKLLAQQV